MPTSPIDSLVFRNMFDDREVLSPITATAQSKVSHSTQEQEPRP